MSAPQNITIALPKGRIAEELVPVLQQMDIQPEPAYFDDSSRLLKFATSRPDVSLIRVRSFDVPTFVSYGVAQIGVAGSDVLLEHDYPNIYSPLDLHTGQCRMSLAIPNGSNINDIFGSHSHVRVATKYINIAKRYFAEKGVQAECIKLNGAMELAPIMDLAPCIVDLVSTGNTLKANGLKEVESMHDISSRLIVNRPAYKTMNAKLQEIMDGFAKAVEGKNA